MNTTAGSTNFLVFLHAINKQRDGLCLEVDVAVKRQ